MTRGAAGVEGIASFGGAHFQIFGAGLEGAAAKQRQQNDVRFAAVGLQHGGAGLPRGSVTSSIELRCRRISHKSMIAAVSGSIEARRRSNSSMAASALSRPVYLPRRGLSISSAWPAAVLLELTRELKGCVVVSDAPIYDSWWLGRLADACRQDRPFRLWSINDAIPALAARAGVSVGAAVKRYLKNAPRAAAPHRAGADAERLLRRLLSIRSKGSG